MGSECECQVMRYIEEDKTGWFEFKSEWGGLEGVECFGYLFEYLAVIGG